VNSSTSSSERSGRQRSCRRWTLRLLCCCLLLSAAAALFNLVVDPFGLYRWVDIEGFNANKYQATKHTRMVKAYRLQQLRPRALALGSSRTEIGIDPEHPAWSARPVFNLAVGGATIREARMLLEFACRQSPPQQVVLGLDFFMFNAHRSADEASVPAARGTLDQLAETVFSAAALQASIATLRTQDPLEDPGYLPNGQIVWTYDLAKVRRYGMHEAFVRNVRKYLGNHYFPPPDRRFSLVGEEGGYQPLAEFARVLRLARQQQIDLRLFISPVHAWQLLTIDEAGLWPLFEAWQRGLAAALEQDRREHPAQPPFVLWDFSGFNPVTTETLPAPGDRTTLMRYYWESSHYRKEAGDLVLSRVLAAGPPAPADFGVPLDGGNVERQLELLRFALADYRRRYPEAAAEIARVRAEFPYLPQVRR
jgi:hypothetical protein